jgi:hypothetical protein
MEVYEYEIMMHGLGARVAYLGGVYRFESLLRNEFGWGCGISQCRQRCFAIFVRLDSWQVMELDNLEDPGLIQQTFSPISNSHWFHVGPVFKRLRCGYEKNFRSCLIPQRQGTVGEVFGLSHNSE